MLDLRQSIHGMIDPRHALARLAVDHGDSLASLSRLLGRNAAYVQQFIERGTPKRLDEDDRLTLARHFQVDERLLGARDPWMP